MRHETVSCQVDVDEAEHILAYQDTVVMYRFLG
jgi:hypothetical protein